MAKILDVIMLALSRRGKRSPDFYNLKKIHQIVTVNPEFVLAAQKDKEFKKVFNSVDLSVADGVGLKVAAWIIGQKIGERITGVDLAWEIAKMSAEKGYRLYLLGATRGVAVEVSKRLKFNEKKSRGEGDIVAARHSNCFGQDGQITSGVVAGLYRVSRKAAVADS